jgi:hypothetical protein
VGAWAKACAGQAAMQGFSDIEAWKIVDLLLDEIREVPIADQSVVIGDLIRQWRKSLQVGSMHVGDVSNTPDRSLLWAVMREVAWAAFAQDSDAKAFHLREAESYLRTYWKANKDSGIRNKEDLQRRVERARTSQYVKPVVTYTATTPLPPRYWGYRG